MLNDLCRESNCGRVDRVPFAWLRVGRLFALRSLVLFAMLCGLFTSIECAMPTDGGVVMSCSGVINQTVPGQGVVSDQVIANMYFGGCSPLDPGMQILERARPGVDPAVLAAACTSDCNARIAAYAASHGETGPLPSCQTVFVGPCDGLGADISTLPANVSSAFQAGGPADSRISLTGTVTLNVSGTSTPVPVAGIADVTFAPCGTFATCPAISRFDVVAAIDPSQPPVIGGTSVQLAQVQNQGIAQGQQTTTQLIMPASSIKAEVTYQVGGVPASFHVTNDKSIVSNGGPAQFLASLDVTMGNGAVRLQLQGTVIGHRPAADVLPHNSPAFECSSPAPTAVSFVSAATDVDQDLQSTRWILDRVVQATDGDPGNPRFDILLPVGAHQLSLVATDSRGATATSSINFSVSDTSLPTIVPPGALTLNSCAFPDVGQATGADRCGGVVISSDSPGNFQTGINTVNWMAEDVSFNDGRATQKVTIVQVADTACCPPGSHVIVMNGTNTATGTSGPDCIIGTSGNDTINGLGGNDFIIGGIGQDTINGGDGNDTIIGGAGDDKLDGGNGNDRIFGGLGQDTITGGLGDDVLIGGDGDDDIHGGDGADRIFGNLGQDHLFGDNGSDHVEGGIGDNTIMGGAGDDELIGWITKDIIDGGSGTNSIFGLDGGDTLTGGAGNDLIWGGRGTNMCVGGGGSDVIAACSP